MSMCSLEKVMEYLPEGTVISPHAFIVGGSTKGGFEEEVVIGDDIYRANFSKGLDPDGYRYGLHRVLGFDKYFCYTSKDVGKTPYELMSEIYEDVQGVYIWMNPNHPCFNRKVKYVRSF